MDNKNILCAGIIFLAVIIMASFVSADYQRSSVAYTNYGSSFGGSNRVAEQKCEMGQDFIIQIAPLGCTPAVVRSDLLEEQDVTVFCQLAATKINPLIDVNAIKRVTVRNIPKSVSGIGVIPSKSALALDQKNLNSPILNNIGYLAIVIPRQKNSSAMPDFIQGTATAELEYDIKNAFGIGQSTFYLPILSDNDWENQKDRYSFWKGKGYLRAENIDENDATITISNDLGRISTLNLKSGETSGKIYLPGFDCLAGLTLKVDDLEAPGTTARLSINGGEIEAKGGEKFLNGACTVKESEKMGFVQLVSISCTDDFGKKQNFDFVISPKVKLKVNGIEGVYGVGERISTGGTKDLFVGYIGSEKGTAHVDDLYIYTFAMPNGLVENLSGADLRAISRVVSGYEVTKSGSGGLSAWVSTKGKLLLSFVIKYYQYLVDGNSYQKIYYSGDGEQVEGTGVKVNVMGFASAENIELTREAQENYDKAMQDFRRDIIDFPETKYPETSKKTKGEEALFEAIKLSFSSDQRRTSLELCTEFKEKYPDSEFNSVLKTYCDDASLADSGIRSQSIFVNNEATEIYFNGIKEPSPEEYSAEITIRGPNKQTQSITFTNNQAFYLNDFRVRNQNEPEPEYIQLSSLDDNSAQITTRLITNPEDKGTINTITRFLFATDRPTLVKDVPTNLNGYSFTLTKVNLKKVAKVTIKDKIDYAGTEANFSFKIGIEKRGIKLSPDEIKKRVDTLNDSINEWSDKSDKLGKVVKGLKTACIATNAYLTVKNFFANTGGKAIARQSVMRGEGGWYQKCENLVRENSAEYPTIEKCLVKHASQINADVDCYYSELQAQNKEIKTLQEGLGEKDSFGQRVINENEFRKNYLDSIRGGLKTNLKTKFQGDSAVIDDKHINIDTFVDNLNASSISTEQLRSLELNSRLNCGSLSDLSSKRLTKEVKTISVNAEEEIARTSFAEKYGIPEVDSGASKDIKVLPITQDITFSQVKDKFNIPYDIKDTSYVRIYRDKSTAKEYLIVLNDERHVDKTYVISFFNTLVLEEKANPLGLDFKKYDDSNYHNPYLSALGDTVPLVRYYETAPYKGYPAIVPFDLDAGWYVSIKQVVSTGANIASYDESGRVNSFYLCNVGENNKEENRGGDDICRSFVNGQYYDQFPGIIDDVTKSLVIKATDAVYQAQKQYSSGVSRVEINRKWIKVGSPAADIPDLQCQDVYSPTECQILFNVCDPVICPSSRCDLGGKYPVKDVIQSGIIGSIALCLPNAQEGIYVPVCLSGVKAGLDSWISVQKSYRDCLQKNLETGETVGICDAMFSIYKCEFFWREGVPIAKIAVPKILGILKGQGTRGGGEYLGVQSAWQSAEKSVSYFTEYYAANSYKAFQSRSTEEVGSEVCKAYVSTVFPTSTAGLDALTEPDSPPQFTARFDEIPFSTATNPPVSQYKVFFHIFAGNDKGVYYKVYMKGADGSSFYQDTSSYLYISGGQGYIPKGEYVTNNVDFTAPSGYKKLCVMVDDQEECNFKQVSTEFAFNYITEKYLAEQASKSDIKTEAECISGSPNPYSLLNPNVQEGVGDVINPGIYNQGIMRTCATENPGKNIDGNWNTNKSRWKLVGYCGDQNMKCWIDSTSVTDVIKHSGIEAETLEELNRKNQEYLLSSGNYTKDFEGDLKNIEGNVSSEEKISLLTALLDRVFYSNQKAHVYYLRGIEYENVVIDLYKKWKIQQEADKRIKEIMSSAIITPPGQIEEMKNYLGDKGIDTSRMLEAQIKETYEGEKEKERLLEEEYVLFELDEGVVLRIGGDDLKYFYKSDSWYFYKDQNSIINTKDIFVYINEENPPYEDSSVGSSGIPAFVAIFESLSKENQDFILSLAEKDYKQGIVTLIKRADQNKDSPIRIKTDYVDYLAGVFILKNLADDNMNFETLYLKFENGKWKWSPTDKDDYKSISEISINSIRFTELTRSTLESLNDKNYEEGAEIIFGINLLKYLITQQQRAAGKTKCEDCGSNPNNWFKGMLINYCIESECLAIGKANNENCVFKEGNPLVNLVIIGNTQGSCVLETGLSGFETLIEFKQRDAEEFKGLVNRAFSNNIPSDILNLGCNQYLDYIAEAAQANQIDPILLLALIDQESDCNKVASSESDKYTFEKGASYGLMQISGKTWCGQYNLPENSNECKTLLVSDARLNIQIGAKILKGYYTDKSYRYKCQAFKNDKQKQDEPAIDQTYSGWTYALRQYNGLSCARSGVFADQDYVPIILNKYNKIVGYSGIVA